MINWFGLLVHVRLCQKCSKAHCRDAEGEAKKNLLEKLRKEKRWGREAQTSNPSPQRAESEIFLRASGKGSG